MSGVLIIIEISVTVLENVRSVVRESGGNGEQVLFSVKDCDKQIKVILEHHLVL